MTNTRVNVGDDCFSPKSNGTDLVVRDMYCNGTHGVSMGSIGQYAGEKSFIRDVHVGTVFAIIRASIHSWVGTNGDRPLLDLFDEAACAVRFVEA